MSKKIRIDLTVSNNKLWWSTDRGVNWAEVGPKSPVTIVQKDCEIQWICEDSTINKIDITMDSGDVLEPPQGTDKDKTSKVNQHCANHSVTKYTITADGTISADPQAKSCDPPCPP